MKDVKGHGSNKRGETAQHAQGTNKIGVVPIHPKALKALINRASVSVKPATGAQPKSGFMVAHPGGAVVSQRTLSGPRGEALLRDFANRNALAINSGAVVGKWTDPKSGKIYLDVSQNVQSQARAMQLGRDRNQIAVWDLNRKRAIATGGNGR